MILALVLLAYRGRVQVRPIRLILFGNFHYIVFLFIVSAIRLVLQFEVAQVHRVSLMKLWLRLLKLAHGARVRVRLHVDDVTSADIQLVNAVLDDDDVRSRVVRVLMLLWSLKIVDITDLDVTDRSADRGQNFAIQDFVRCLSWLLFAEAARVVWQLHRSTLLQALFSSHMLVILEHLGDVSVRHSSRLQLLGHELRWQVCCCHHGIMLTLQHAAALATFFSVQIIGRRQVLIGLAQEVCLVVRRGTGATIAAMSTCTSGRHLLLINYKDVCIWRPNGRMLPALIILNFRHQTEVCALDSRMNSRRRHLL